MARLTAVEYVGEGVERHGRIDVSDHEAVVRPVASCSWCHLRTSSREDPDRFR
jgi:hypothetical protein